MLASDIAPPVQVSNVSEKGIQLVDGLLLPSACVFLEGQVFLWDVPSVPSGWAEWSKKHFELFETVVPRPELLVFGTGPRLHMPPSFVRGHLRELGIGLEVMDTRNACSTYNMLSEEGRRVAAALLPLQPHAWTKDQR